jgi:hypothetical protein
MIYTTYFANVKNLPSNIIPISIAGKAPAGWNGLEYKKLAPKWSFFSVWKETQDNDYYIEHFQKEVLDKITILQVLRDLIDLSLPTDMRHPSPMYFALVCYESPEKFCHRHLVADWLNANGIECKEFENADLLEG